jgi:hypothetical protein
MRPSPRAGDPAGSPSCEALADPAVLDGLVVAEEPGERVEQSAGAGDGHTNRTLLIIVSSMSSCCVSPSVFFFCPERRGTTIAKHRLTDRTW